MRLLSLDPGGTTGYALIDYDDDYFRIIESGQVAGGLKGFIEWDSSFFEAIGVERIICESFTLREGIYGADLSPVYIIGALEALYQNEEIIYQEPKLKPLCDDERLKKMGYHERGKPHRNDALRHAIIYLRNNKHMPTLLAGWKE